jgi:hypothetical protein
VKNVEEACERLLGIRKRVKEGLPREPKVENRKRKPVEGDGVNWSVVARGDTNIATHTSFLTFGELMPLINEGIRPAETQSDEPVGETIESAGTTSSTIDT